MFHASQVLDNHVIRYIPPEEYVKTMRGAIHFKNRKPLGCLVVGAQATNPEKVKHLSLQQEIAQLKNLIRQFFPHLVY